MLENADHVPARLGVGIAQHAPLALLAVPALGEVLRVLDGELRLPREGSGAAVQHRGRAAQVEDGLVGIDLQPRLMAPLDQGP